MEGKREQNSKMNEKGKIGRSVRGRERSLPLRSDSVRVCDEQINETAVRYAFLRGITVNDAARASLPCDRTLRVSREAPL